MVSRYQVISNQFAPHPNTELLAAKHARTNFSRPLTASQKDAFETANRWVNMHQRPVILDSGCGTGESTIWLAKKFPTHSVLGIDQSLVRLQKAENKASLESLSNILFLRARLEDFWRLAKESNWPITHNFLFYPNPWPKSEHLSRRWHGHPVFPTLLRLSGYLEVRSNWLIYLQEFSLALNTVINQKSSPQLILNPERVSAFEKKYVLEQCPCYVLTITIA